DDLDVEHLALEHVAAQLDLHRERPAVLVDHLADLLEALREPLLAVHVDDDLEPHGVGLPGAVDVADEQERVGLPVAGGAKHLRLYRVPQVVAAVRLLDPEDVPDPQVAVLAAAGGAQAAAWLRVPGVVAELEERVLAGDALLEHDLDQGGGGPRPLDADVAVPAHEDAVVARDRGREVGGERAAGDEDEERVGEPERVVVPEEVAGDGDRLVLAAVVDDGADVLEGVQVEGVAIVALQQDVGAAVA